VELTLHQALWFLPFAAPIAFYVAWSDLKFMRIPNRAVLFLGALFMLIGPIALPFDVFLWRLAQLMVVLAVGFMANAAGLVGGGDAKFAAVMAPFFAAGDMRLVLVVFAGMLLGAFVTHRFFLRVALLRALVPDWKSWTTGRDFPMGLALAGTLIFYLLLGLTGG